jgi:fatty-acyl-CoA synthase
MGEWLAHRADRTPSRPALVLEDTTWTYAELHAECERIATGLRERGVAPEDRVAYLGVNHPAFIAVMLGCARLGAIMTPVNFRLSPPEICFVLADAGASVLIYDAALAAAVQAIKPDLPCKSFVRNDLDINPVLPGFAGSEERPGAWPSVSGSQVALLVYTSGTQASPKGTQMIAAHPDFDGADLSSLGWVYCGGAPVNPQVVLRCAERGIPVCNGYGMTEAAPLISILVPMRP